MGDHERLLMMARAAESEIERAGIDTASMRYDVLTGAGARFRVSYWPRGRGFAEWSIRVSAPYDTTIAGTPIPHQPAALCFDGQITPLSLRIVTALDKLMWKDRT